MRQLESVVVDKLSAGLFERPPNGRKRQRLIQRSRLSETIADLLDDLTGVDDIEDPNVQEMAAEALQTHVRLLMEAVQADPGIPIEVFIIKVEESSIYVRCANMWLVGRRLVSCVHVCTRLVYWGNGWTDGGSIDRLSPCLSSTPNDSANGTVDISAAPFHHMCHVFVRVADGADSSLPWATARPANGEDSFGDHLLRHGSTIYPLGADRLEHRVQKGNRASTARAKYHCKKSGTNTRASRTSQPGRRRELQFRPIRVPRDV